MLFRLFLCRGRTLLTFFPWTLSAGEQAGTAGFDCLSAVFLDFGNVLGIVGRDLDHGSILDIADFKLCTLQFLVELTFLRIACVKGYKGKEDCTQ